ncbi:Vms1/Ankzf1 family peptidyl-tRNA hydrolase [Halovivax gelatinilyticus]|uniref:Vms1/Ankzf1 family peptidyl-tRNA hydrolase n=1 Tax=Halovivax gelatinilyticus TaxID=2961597 RepID=UPI0020CA692F|nr:Vms1/Ankzf1 family peptidyl-tRNA hydrolase [Halovivax gelatinilyticus]
MSRLDEWLGRAPLKAEIDELEDELERQRERYEAESERRKEAVSARQRAQETVNRLEDRIAQLEGELARVDEDERTLEPRRRETIRGDRIEAVIDRIRSLRSDPESILTASVEPGSVPDDVESLLGERAQLLREAAPCLLVCDDAGIVSVALESPIEPTVEPTWADRPRLEREWFRPHGTHLVALVRADLFALGRYDGTERVDYVGFESDVKGAHSKGGFSQARFERIRDGQIDDHLDAARASIEDVREDEPLYLVGQRDAIGELAEELDADATSTVDATGSPESALGDAVYSFWTTELVVL